ncbi:hypothetical protein BW247_08200 [Acidihalobacter ferrooxydans]|uniref:Uncharacterized protein n=1 Tax=Acidihalobacter ferrooxydans TaxID=1765967 RepID=A0A1P8UH33_9GAMM|nr:hypothetical protein BW247_08200 [Acidihalobacter ferrooxydans]
MDPFPRSFEDEWFYSTKKSEVWVHYPIAAADSFQVRQAPRTTSSIAGYQQVCHATFTQRAQADTSLVCLTTTADLAGLLISKE